MIARSFRFALSIVVVLCACPRQHEATFFPASVGPCESLRIQIASADLDSTSHTRVTIAGQTAPVVRVVSSHVLEVIVPRLPAQTDAPVAVFSGNQQVGTGELQILDAAALRLVLTVDKNTYSVVRSTPSGDAPTGHVRDMGARLSIDVLTGQGTLIHSATILDPSQTPMERFVPAGDPQGSVRAGRRSVPGPKAFAVTIPATAEGASIRIYRAPAGLDVMTEDGRAKRSLLATLEL